MDEQASKLTGVVVLIVGFLFLLKDLGLPIIGPISGWTIIFVLAGAALLAGLPVDNPKPVRKKRKR